MPWLLPLLACSGTSPSDSGTGTDDVTCDHGDVNQEFGFLGVDVFADNASPHHVSFSAKLSASAPLEVACTLDTDSDEVHVVTSGDALCHEVDLYGLLADRDYSCELTSLAVGETVALRTAEGSEHLPDTSVDEHDESRRTGAYTLVAHLEKTAEPNQLKLLIVDAHGRIRWSWFAPEGLAGDLDAQYLGEGRIFTGGGLGVPPTILRLSGSTEWVGPDPSLGGSPHHHVELLEDDDVLMLATLPNTDDLGDFTGFSAERIGLYSATVDWAFDSQVAVDAGQLGRPDDDRDPWHANALVPISDVDGEQVLVSLYELRQILRVDPETDLVVWRLGASGDFTLLDADGEPLGNQGWFAAAHAPELDGDRLLLYDNGTSSAGSRILELTLDEQAMTARQTWSWTEAGWQEPIWGDVDDLGNGHLLITRGHCDECGGANPESRSEVLELDRETEEVVWRLRFPHADDGLYRAQAIGGCELFANAKYCAE